MNDNFNDNNDLDSIDNTPNNDDNTDTVEKTDNTDATDTVEKTDSTDTNDSVDSVDSVDTAENNSSVEEDLEPNSTDSSTESQDTHAQENPYNGMYPPNFDPNMYNGYPPYPPYPPQYPPYQQYPPFNPIFFRPYVPPMNPRDRNKIPPQHMNMNGFNPNMYNPNMYNPNVYNPNMYNSNVHTNEDNDSNDDEDFLDSDDDIAIETKKIKNLRFTVLVLILSLVVCIITSLYATDSGVTNINDSYSLNGDYPSMEIAYTPDPVPSNDPTGILTNSEIHAKVSPSVVGIAVYTRGLGQVLQSEGSGVIMSDDGFVITNYHVIANDASNPVVKIEVILSNGETYEARVIGGDSKTDLAVLKINAPDLISAEFGDSSKLQIGDRVAVIGNPSGLAFAGSFTQGCVSALSRSIYMSDLNAEIEYIQTDAAINSGNSGGAFINEYGQVVGISAAKMKVEAGYEGMGFAIPINNAKVVVDSLIEHGYVAGRPRVGIEYKAISQTLADLNSIPVGLRVYVVNEDVDAYNHIVAGDIITMFDGIEVYDSESVANALSDKRAGETMVVTVYRVSEETGVSEYIDVTIILSESVGENLAETMY